MSSLKFIKSKSLGWCCLVKDNCLSKDGEKTVCDVHRSSCLAPYVKDGGVLTGW